MQQYTWDYMKKILLIVIITAFFLQSPLLAIRRRGDYFDRPQIGLKFGPASPLFEVSEAIDSTIGFGFFSRINIPQTEFKIGYDLGYQNHESKTENSLGMLPMYGTLQYRLPIDTPLNFQVRAGGGMTSLWSEPDGMSRWDPTGVGGFEVSFPAGKIINLGLQIDYLVLYEEHLEGSEVNGHFFSAMLCLFFNL
jgi:hypothetical protein